MNQRQTVYIVETRRAMSPSNAACHIFIKIKKI
jgi:hypothetical protein